MALVYEQDFSLESVKHVARALELTEDPIDLVQFLVNRSLPARVDANRSRFQMLQMLRSLGMSNSWQQRTPGTS